TSDTKSMHSKTGRATMVPKGSRRLTDVDDMIVSLYAGGMTIRDIQHHMATAMRVDISHETISAVTDAVLDEVMVWQNRQLDEFYPVVFLDALRTKVRDDGRVVNKSAYMAIGVDLDGIKHILGLWIAKEEGASFWAQVCANLSNRGVKDVFIVCCDGLKGLPEAVEATWPNSMVQTCIVHLIRAANRWVAYGDRRGVSAALKKIYTATDKLKHIDTAILLNLRQELGLALPGERVIVDVEDLRESIGYVRAVDNRDEAGFTKRFNAAIKRIQNDYSLLSTTETEGRLEVSPVLRQLFDASTVTAIRDEYARLARAEDTEEDTSDE
ncbi:IS256 family transposase, partial [Corynebacterium striatum]|uniref:IS256 family transposase n=1 Tax=Corynebacterium striatum TaxID=43770 RepID=UPI001364D219